MSKRKTVKQWAYELAADLLEHDSNILEPDGSDLFHPNDPDRDAKLLAIKQVIDELKERANA